MSINDDVYFLLMSCQHDAGEGSLCRDENNKDVFIFSTDECGFIFKKNSCMCVLGGTAILNCGHTCEGRECLLLFAFFRKMYSNALLKGECTALNVYSNMWCIVKELIITNSFH